MLRDSYGRVAYLAGISAGVIGSIVTWYATLYLPIYPDEIAYRVLTSRGFVDGMVVMNVYPTCTGAFAAPMPYSWIPAKTLTYLLLGFIENPLFLRAIGLLTILAAAAAVIHALRPRAADLLLAVSIGVIPFNLAMVRPEGAMLLLVVGMLLILRRLDMTSTVPTGTVPKLGRYCLAAAFVLVSTTLYTLHPKALFLAPAVLYIGGATSAHVFTSRAGKSLWFILLCFCAVEAYAFWKFSYSCPEDPVINGFFSTLRLDPGTLASDPAGFIQQAWKNMASTYDYVSHVGFHAKYTIDWLPATNGNPLNAPAKTANALIAVSLLALLGMVVAAIAKDAVRLARAELPGNDRIIAALLFAGLVGYAALNTSKLFYEVAFVWPMLALVYALQSRTLSSPPYAKAYRMVLAAAAAATAIAVADNFVPAFLRGFSGPGISAANFSNERAEKEVQFLSSACHIPSDGRSRYVVVDDMTYGYFSRTTLPILVTYLHFGADHIDEVAFLRRIGSSGLVTQCGHVPDQLKSRATRISSSGQHGEGRRSELELCCVARERLIEP